MVGISVADLWWEYFVRGGTAAYEELAAMLMGVEPMSTGDHDLSATILNEWFNMRGMGAPIATSDTTLSESGEWSRGHQ
jgi:hypothetical protein